MSINCSYTFGFQSMAETPPHRCALEVQKFNSCVNRLILSHYFSQLLHDKVTLDYEKIYVLSSTSSISSKWLLNSAIDTLLNGFTDIASFFNTIITFLPVPFSAGVVLYLSHASSASFVMLHFCLHIRNTLSKLLNICSVIVLLGCVSIHESKSQMTVHGLKALRACSLLCLCTSALISEISPRNNGQSPRFCEFNTKHAKSQVSL